MAIPQPPKVISAHYVAYVVLLMLAGIGLAFWKGNPQWSKYIYLFQKNILNDKRLNTSGMGAKVRAAIRGAGATGTTMAYWFMNGTILTVF